MFCFCLILDNKIKALNFFSLQCKINAESGDPEDELTPEAVEFCRVLGSNATRVSEIAGGRDRAVHAAIQEGINRVNEKATSNAQRIQRWTVLDRDFSVTGGELGECVFVCVCVRRAYVLTPSKTKCLTI